LFKVKKKKKKIANKKLSIKTKEHTTWNFRLLKNIKRKTLSKNLFGINHNCKITLDTPADLLFLKKIEKNKNFKNVDCLNDVKKLTKVID
jgi:spore coat polysaccharide biosynthesis protein SpsF (cytidylyltransferase family)